MKLTAYLHSRPPYRWVGGELMTLDLLMDAQQQGHDVTVILESGPREPSEWAGLPCVPARGRGAVRAIQTADLIVTHPELAHGPARIHHRRTPAPTIGIVHNLNPATVASLEKRPPTILIANSHHTARALPTLGITQPATVIHPPIHPRPIPGITPIVVAACNLSPHKAGPILAPAARANPNTTFVGILGGHGQQHYPNPMPPNLHLTPQGPTTLTLNYATLVLAPSTTETFGMWLAEAVALGRATLATDLPAHREAAGEAPHYLPDTDPATWAAAITQALTHDRHTQLTAQAQAQAPRILQRTQASYRTWRNILTQQSA